MNETVQLLQGQRAYVDAPGSNYGNPVEAVSAGDHPL